MNVRAVDAVMEDVDRHLLAGQFDQAIEALDRARRNEPANFLILQRLGDVYRSFERPTEAIDAYEQAIAIAPEHGELWVRKGDALIDLRDGDSAIAAFHEASRLTPSAFSELDWNLRGDRCYSYADYETARRLYEHGLRLRPNADGWRGLGLVSVASGRVDEAVKAYKRGLDLEPEHVDLLNRLGVAYLDQGQSLAALDIFQRLVVLAPELPSSWSNLALASRESGKIQAAHDAYLKVVEMTPDDADAWTDLGVCELDLGEGEFWLRKALVSFERAIEVDDHAYWGWNNAGWVLSQLGEFTAAVERLDRAIELHETEVTPWVTKVWALARSGQLRRAEVCANKMLTVADDRVEALTTKGRLLADWTMNHTEALDVLREALALRPGDVWIESDIAEVLLKVGDYDESRKVARKLLKLELDEDVCCAMLFIVYAGYVLEGTTSPERRNAFREFIDYYRSHFVTGAPKPSSWNYQGLANLIHRNSEVSNEESAFLLTMAIDMQVGTIDARTASFFTGKPAARPSQSAAV
jgi:tetratricopeptide (TPR) repeat protein